MSKINKAKVLCLLILFFCRFSVIGQDIHFSQYLASPANLNPALTGNFDGDYRFIANQRNQWRAITNPYTFRTFGGSFDIKNLSKASNTALGLSIYDDKGGDSDFSTLQINAAGSISKSLNSDSTLKLLVAVQSGFTQRNLNLQRLRFDNQYNGTYFDPNISNQENLVNNNLSYLNLNTGIAASYIYSNNLSLLGGISLYNINQPKQGLIANSNINLDQRLNIFVNASYNINPILSMLPGIFYSLQGKYRENIIGSNFKYILNSNPYHFRAINFGIWTRRKDAGFICLGMDYDKVNATISYDLTTSQLNNASNYRGGFEFSVTYIIARFKPTITKQRICPSFI